MENRTYEDAVKVLNTLQGKQARLLKEDEDNAKRRKTEQKLKKMVTFTERAGVKDVFGDIDTGVFDEWFSYYYPAGTSVFYTEFFKMERLDQLSVVHVSGTKGKGSTCAFSESILRHHGYKTGFYSSPHLMEVRERIRINGKPLSKELFTKYFFECWDNLHENKDNYEGKMPPYFMMMTLMSFHVFLEEKVDVAVVEVGIGGTYDSTNIVKNPVVCGVTSLGMDHVKLLGPTLEDIAEQKAGIFKPGAPAFTVNQEEGALQRVFQRARELKIPFHLVPRLEDYPGELPELSLDWNHQHVNASLALQLCNTWLQKAELSKDNPSQKERSDSKSGELDVKKPSVAATFEITEKFRKGLKNTVWKGRCQTIVRPNITFYLDGAHTPKSVEASAEWFKTRADEEAKKTGGVVARVLLFNLTRDRDPNVYLKPLLNLEFDHVVFSPNIINLDTNDFPDITMCNVTPETLLKKCKENQKVWIKFRDDGREGQPITSQDDDHVINDPYSTVFPCLTQVIQWIAAGRDPLIPKNENGDFPYPESLAKATRIQFLITGSLHLVGDVMKALGPEITGEV